jgi:hypothetical protein
VLVINCFVVFLSSDLQETDGVRKPVVQIQMKFRSLQLCI